MDTVDTFHRLAGFPMRLAPKKSRSPLPLWRNRRRGLHAADVR
jgi:hypothetical protein